MRKTLLAGLAFGLFTVAVPTGAHAAGYDFRGGCGYTVPEDPDPRVHLDTRPGEADVFIVATDDSWSTAPPGTVDTGHRPTPDVPVTDVWCEWFVNGVSQGAMVTAPDATGFTANAAPFSYDLDEYDVVDVCTHATIGGTPITKCPVCSCSQIPPQAVKDLIDPAMVPVDTASCAALATLAPTVNAIAPDRLYADPATGDVTVSGVGTFDCPPR